MWYAIFMCGVIAIFSKITGFHFEEQKEINKIKKRKIKEEFDP